LTWTYPAVISSPAMAHTRHIFRDFFVMVVPTIGEQKLSCFSSSLFILPHHQSLAQETQQQEACDLQVMFAKEAIEFINVEIFLIRYLTICCMWVTMKKS